MSFRRPSKLVMILSLLVIVIVGIGGWTSMYLLNKANESSETLADAKSNGEIRVVDHDAIFVDGNKEEEFSREVAKMHAYFNKLLGWGAWRTFEPKSKDEELESQLEYINDILLPETSGSLAVDMERAAKGIEKALETNTTEEMFITHRIFHDLDVVMNDNVAEDYWGATATYGK
ncbi:hypothetical protein [Pseudalkalibacillus salsuginis]|uniref:hypothetical protein n=1 Tax=Pseudalkalibacillus salsuginis TaxID=2910972 RepID=UPI001F2ED478|nr:hypothetical protein [Pseudalkalibacillus salsuginis]MCF6411159.1 hypothetical protein [Pseudalkalibacillus salsuginis]